MYKRQPLAKSLYVSLCDRTSRILWPREHQSDLAILLGIFATRRSDICIAYGVALPSAVREVPVIVGMDRAGLELGTAGRKADRP